MNSLPIYNLNFLNKGEYEGELKKLLDFLFHNDKDYDAFSENNLRRQLEIFGEDISDRGYITWEDVVKYFDKLKPGFDTLLFEICKLMDKEKQGAKGPSIYQVITCSNQIHFVAFMCTTFDTSFIFAKNVAKCFFDICNAEIAQCGQKLGVL